ncbi:MAG TPA: hypothetical protein VFS40_03425 [Gemmatimonadales bacterium]|nr:hypothetical protein [Gemmatimonadales bacterium]
MRRTLTIARATVAPGRDAEYLALVAELAQLVRGEGRRFWVFRNAADPLEFVEFREGTGGWPIRRLAGERRLEQRLRELALYDETADEMWNEVPLADRPVA